jgi:hypothetical protein
MERGESFKVFANSQDVLGFPGMKKRGACKKDLGKSMI